MLISILHIGSTTATGAAGADQALQLWAAAEDEVEAVLVIVLETTAVLVTVVFLLLAESEFQLLHDGPPLTG